jgi:hypothetical protein
MPPEKSGKALLIVTRLGGLRKAVDNPLAGW